MAVAVNKKRVSNNLDSDILSGKLKRIAVDVKQVVA